MSEYIPLRVALGRIEAKLLVDHGVSIERPIAAGNHPLIAHLLDHDALSPVKGCKLCALLKAHQLLSDAIAEDEDLPRLPPEDLEDLEDDLQDLQDREDRKEAAFQRWIRESLDPEEPDL